MSEQCQRLNWKFSMDDIDFIVGLARANRSAVEICERVLPRNITTTPEKIRDICWQSGITVRHGIPTVPA